MRRLVDEHRVLVVRGFAPLVGDELPEYCEALGELLEWEFGVVNELKLDAEKRNYIYTNAEVPLHWDGAFVERVPHYIFFHCDSTVAGSHPSLRRFLHAPLEGRRHRHRR